MRRHQPPARVLAGHRRRIGRWHHLPPMPAQDAPWPEAAAVSAEEDTAAASRWLSYAEAGAVLGIDPESVKRRAQRAGWPRQSGNDGRTLVAVPEELLREAATVAPDKSPVSSPAGDPMAVIAEELRQLAGDLRQAQAGRQAAEALVAELRGELVRLQGALYVPLRFSARQAPPPGMAVVEARATGRCHWQLLENGFIGPACADRWSAWRAAWRFHRQRGESA